MKGSEIARRYARAFHLAAQENEKDVSKGISVVFEELREMEIAFSHSPELRDFFVSVVMPPDLKIKAIASLAQKISQPTSSFFRLLTENGRWDIFSDVVFAFQELSDASHGVTRGTVRSAVPLGPEQRTTIEKTVQNRLGKKVILSFEEDKNLLGGMVAQVGGWTFDDSIASHLSRLNEYMKRRSNEAWKQ